MNTNDLSKFGRHELDIAQKILYHYCNDKITQRFKDHFGSNVRLELNPSSGEVFLVDDNYNTAMIDGDTLDLFLFTPDEGREGFFDELVFVYDLKIGRAHV